PGAPRATRGGAPGGGAKAPADAALWLCRPAAFFTETPHDVTARAGEDVEMACSFRGSGSPSYSLEIQWWYLRTHRDWTDKQNWASSQLKASPQEEAGKEATKISVVKVAGSNISHKLRLSRVKPADEGTYECRVIDFSDSRARQHKVKAYLRVEAAGAAEPLVRSPEQPGRAPRAPPRPAPPLPTANRRSSCTTRPGRAKGQADRSSGSFAGPESHVEDRRSHPFEVDCSVRLQRLHFFKRKCNTPHNLPKTTHTAPPSYAL
uniref:V-set and transmembrane domain-containing protein 2-like protein n=1 Tax=Varanus komodoensis TaxID=61221 RepID=A0A8D2L222_VARKO